MKFLSTIFILFFFEFAIGQIPGTPTLFSSNQIPRVYTHSVTSPNSSLITAHVNAQIINTAQNPITASGVLWGSGIPTISSNIGISTDGITTGGPFTSIANPLPLDKDSINFVAYATTNNGKTYYGKVLTIYRTVTSPFTSKVWLAFNLGATTMPVSPSPTPDVTSYGNLYQWGRTSDGHEIAQPTKSGQTTTLAADYTNTTSSFITNSSGTQNWLTSDNPNLWQGTTGLNNPCPIGYRVPALSEFSNETINFSSQNISGAFNSFLKLPVTGSRDNSGNVIGYTSHDIGRYWTSTINGSYSRPVYLTASGITQPTDLSSSARVNGFAVRCIKGEISSGGSAIVTAYTLGTSAGTMTASVPVSAVTQTISATVSKTGDYNIAAIANGVTYSAKGIFSQTGNQDIVLTASGTPELGTAPGSSISYVLNTVPSITFTRTVQGWTTNGTAEVSSYTLISSSSTLYAGVPVSEVKQTFVANVITPGSYNITAINNGLTYRARGTFLDIGNQNLELTASGTPTNTGTFTFNSNTTPSATFTSSFIDLSTNGTAVVSAYSPSSSTGTTIIGEPVSNVTQTFIANVTKAGTYTITTNTTNGLTFTANGVFANTGNQTVILIASGTYISTGTITLTSNTTPNIIFTRKIISKTTNGTSIISSINSSNVNGSMSLGVPIAEGSVFQRLTVNSSVAGDYDISTQTVNGVTFRGIGNLTAGNNVTLDLFASGTPTATGYFGFVTNTSPSSTFYRYIYNASTNGIGVVSSYTLKSSRGTIAVGREESGSNVETITANVTGEGSYDISTNTANGITFSASGGFPSFSGPRDIELVASGTPIAEGTFTYTINTTPSVTFTRTAIIPDQSSNGTAKITSYSGQVFFNEYGYIISGQTLVPANNVFNRYIVNVQTAGTYAIVASNNGVTFSKFGSLPVGPSQTIDLIATGIPTVAGNHTYTLNVSGVTGNLSLNRTTIPHPSSNGNGHIESYNSSSSAGIMTGGIPVSGVTQTFNVTVTRLGSYDISTNTVNGVTFSASGIFTNTGNQDILLTASGTPTSSGSSFSYTLNTLPNSNFTRTVGAPDVSTNGSAIVSGYSSNSSAGTMTAGIPVSGVTQTFIANVTTAGSYSITTTVNGLTFAANGTFTETGNQNIILTASGKPTAEGTYTYTSNTNPNVSFTRTVEINPTSNGTANISSITPLSSTGTMYLDAPVSSVTQSFTANVTSSGSYSITTNTANGITFASSASTIGTGNKTITLVASGTPIATGTFTYTINTNPSISFTRSTVVQPSTNGTAIVGTYNFGTPLSAVGRLWVGKSTSVSGHATIINANVTQVGTYTITTNTNYGITYSGSGTFNNIGTQNVFLYATGTPTQTIAAASNVYDLNTTPKMATAITRQIYSLGNLSTNGTATASSYTNGTSAGTMTATVLVSGVTQTISANQTSSASGTYFITTNAVNGVIFSSGSVTLSGIGSKTITLTAYGKPISAGTFTYTTDTTPSVTFTITVNQ